MDSNKIAHLNMIEGCINRMAGNSALFKGFAVTIVVAALALTKNVAWYVMALIVIAPMIIMSIMDAYYLSEERKYRNMYNAVKNMAECDIDFNLNANSYANKETKLAVCYFSKSILMFYFSLLIIAILAVTLIYIGG